ncbi:GNAT family N-acetyltransferase [Peribacillus frigoritolerans]|uniref:GNAT family N-acetyltransferase n=1 Tax=Peribacillus frigoritolerans TaxID=450367 RepID=UPI001059391D|nr:GNAT family N-acetyltransferase [Peribacillus frigoritolerans]TDL79999.1 GNAT family N-acetyltransferase [Peribacillus frigoritolerans]
MIRIAEKSDYEEVARLSQYSLKNDCTEINRLQNKCILGDFESEKLIAKIHILDQNIYFSGGKVKMGGLSSICVLPEKRRKHDMDKLLFEALVWMKNRGYSISYLHPSSIPYYRKFGWELISNEKQWTIRKGDLRLRTFSGSCKVKELSGILALPFLQAVYDCFSKENNGMLVRSEEWWKKEILKENHFVFVHFLQDGSADGYLICRLENKKLYIDECIALNDTAKKSLWTFICRKRMKFEELIWRTYEQDHFSFLLKNPFILSKVKPSIMGRIINVKSFLEQYMVAPAEMPLFLHIHDSFADWNSGTYLIKNGEITHFQKASQGSACSHPPKRGLQMDISVLTAVFFRYMNAASLYDAGLIQGPEDDLDLLKKMLQSKKSICIDRI